MDAPRVFKSTFKALKNEDYSISTDIDRYQGVLEYALSKAGIYMVSRNLNLSIGKTVGYNYKILISNTSIKVGSNKDMNKDHKKLSMTLQEPGKVEDAAPKVHSIKSTDKPITETGNQRMHVKIHNDEKLTITILIVGAGLVAYHFW